MNLREEWVNTQVWQRVRKYKEEPNRAEEYNSWKKNTLEVINSRLGDTKKEFSKLEDRVVEITQAEQKEKKRI